MLSALKTNIDIINDNKNFESVDKCWDKEKTELLEECTKCDMYYGRLLNACRLTGYKETLNCEQYGTVSKR